MGGRNSKKTPTRIVVLGYLGGRRLIFPILRVVPVLGRVLEDWFQKLWDDGAAWATTKLQKSEADWQIMAGSPGRMPSDAVGRMPEGDGLWCQNRVPPEKLPVQPLK